MKEKKIIIVEDEPIVAEDIKRIMENYDYTVPKIVHKPDDILDNIKSNKPDIVLMDINLGNNLVGIDMAKTINNKFNIPVVFLTAYSDRDTIQKAALTGSFGYIIKPYHERDLYATIETALSRHHIEKALHKSEKKYRQLVESLHEGIVILDTDLKFLFANNAATNIFGQTKKELSKTNINDYLFSTQDFRKQLNIKKQNKFEINIRNNTGKKKILKVSSTTQQDEKGKKTFFLLLNNITDLKKIQKEKKEMQKLLAQKQKMETIGQLAGGIAHDFNNYLTTINGYTEKILNEISNSDKLKEELKIIRDCGNKAANLTKQLLGFSRKQIIKPKKINCNKIIEKIKKVFYNKQTKLKSLTYDLADNLKYIKADPVQIEQILMNLVINAFDAIKDNGKIIIKTDNLQIERNQTTYNDIIKPGQYIQLVVKDNGIGIKEQDKKHIFEPFFTTKNAEKGTGLGLSTVYGIVKQNQGYIKFSSQLNQGSTFRIIFPVFTPQKSQPVHHKTTRIEPRNNTILIVEDDNDILKFLVEILTDYNYKIIDTDNSRKALNIAKQRANEMDLLLTDITLPDINGIELSKKIMKIYPKIKTLFISGYTQDEAIRKNIMKKNIHFLPKPFTPDKLIKKIKKILTE